VSGVLETHVEEIITGHLIGNVKKEGGMNDGRRNLPRARKHLGVRSFNVV
jgi:hypothetical protein